MSLANVADGDDGCFEKSHGVSPLSAEDLLLTSSQAERLRRVETATRGGERLRRRIVCRTRTLNNRRINLMCVCEQA